MVVIQKVFECQRQTAVFSERCYTGYQASGTQTGTYIRTGILDKNGRDTGKDPFMASYRIVFSVVPKSKVKIVVKMLKAIHAQERKKASREKAKAVVAELRAMKLKEAARKVEDGIEETLTYCNFPSEHWTCIRTNNMIERLNRERRRRTRMVGGIPRWELRPDPGLREAPLRGRHPVGQQEIHEYEAFGGSSGRRLHCRLTSFGRGLQTFCA